MTPDGRSLDSFETRRVLETPVGPVTIFDPDRLEGPGRAVERLPYSIRVLLENLLRHEDGETVTRDDVARLAGWDGGGGEQEISFRPARVLLQDFTGVPAIVDLAAMRDAMAELGGDPARINPMLPAELVIDHSVQVDSFGREASFLINAEQEFVRNRERYAFLRWGQDGFEDFRVVPPDTGIVHQVNLEHLARVVFGPDDAAGGERTGREGTGLRSPASPPLAYPDTLVGTDSHTTMINGLGVLGWGVGGIEAEAAMLGQPISLLVPEVVGFRLKGELPEGATATDMVLRVTEMLREKGVVGKFVEFFGPGISSLSLADRATIGNMSPEYGATCAIFPVDAETLAYLRFTGRSEERVALVEAVTRAQGLFHEPGSVEPEYSDTLELDLAGVEPSLAGPKLPQQRIVLSEGKKAFAATLEEMAPEAATDLAATAPTPAGVRVRLDAEAALGDEPVEFELRHGAVVIAAITSCTNTSNPSVMVGAGLLARNAVERGLSRKPWVKTSLAPGSRVVTDYLDHAGLTPPLQELGFNLVGYGCTTCIGNSGPLPGPISEAVREHDLVVCSVLSGNRNFEGRINPDTRANYLASPPLVVAYALAGRMDVDLVHEPLGRAPDGTEVHLRDVWPSQEEIRETIRSSVKTEMFRKGYEDVFEGDERWNSLPVPAGERFAWDADSTYVRQPPFFTGMGPEPEAPRDLEGARALVVVGDSVTTDHISPAGAIALESPAARYLRERGVAPSEFNSYGSRRGNHEVMMRGTFANTRLRNRMVPGREGGYTIHVPSGEETDIFDAAARYREEETPLIILAGDQYGTGSSRDWAAKGPALLGVRAVIAAGYERIHRSNLIGMGVLPLQFAEGEDRETLGLDGFESFRIEGIADDLEPGGTVRVLARRDADPAGLRDRESGKTGASDRREADEVVFDARVRVDTGMEMAYYRHGGILRKVIRDLL